MCIQVNVRLLGGFRWSMSPHRIAITEQAAWIWRNQPDFDLAAMLEEDMEVAIKVVVVGNGAVGKSSMIQRYCKGVFTKDYKKTIGVDFLERQIV